MGCFFFFFVCPFLLGRSVALGVLAFFVLFFYLFFPPSFCVFILGFHVVLGRSVAVRGGKHKDKKRALNLLFFSAFF